MMNMTPKHWCLSPHSAEGFLRREAGVRRKKDSSSSFTQYLYFNVPRRYGLVNMTSLVEESVKSSQVQEGLCFVSAMHITAGVYINDAESGLLADIAKWIEKLAPFKQDYLHHQTGEDNGDAHLKSYLTHPSVTLPITGGRLDLGTWQQVFYAEFDGLREKRVLIKSLGMT